MQQDVGGLERLDAADEQQHDRVLRHPDDAAGGGAVSRGEAVEIDTGRDDEGAVGVGAVEPDQLTGLLVGVRDQPVGLGDDLFLADHTGAGLRSVALGQRLVLDLGERVRGVDERDAPAVAGEPADLAGEPVVRVDDVVEARLVLGLLAQDGSGEGAQLRGELLLAEALERAGADVAHRHARAHLDHRREVAGGGAGEDVDLDAAGGQAAGGLDDVDVHAAGVAGAGLVERARVHRQRGHAAGRDGAGEAASGHGFFLPLSFR